ncbi:hypothetical protein GGR54DRAFT_99814 [Hypoxylon sp. NC1633]|nr:hypothetical protein GGR54DRAFT_99814 [Hypoxylon sp. NC1633]
MRRMTVKHIFRNRRSIRAVPPPFLYRVRGNANYRTARGLKGETIPSANRPTLTISQPTSSISHPSRLAFLPFILHILLSAFLAFLTFAGSTIPHLLQRNLRVQVDQRVDQDVLEALDPALDPVSVAGALGAIEAHLEDSDASLQAADESSGPVHVHGPEVLVQDLGLGEVVAHDLNVFAGRRDSTRMRNLGRWWNWARLWSLGPHFDGLGRLDSFYLDQGEFDGSWLWVFERFRDGGWRMDECLRVYGWYL